MTLVLPRAARDRIVADCLRRRPMEACGVLSRNGRVVPLRNAAASADFFAFDPDEQLRLWQELDEAGDRVRAVYHSHTRSPAVPSAVDLRYAADPDIHYVIVSLSDPGSPDVTSWEVAPEGLVKEELTIVQ